MTTRHSTRGPCKRHRHHRQHQTNCRGSARTIEVRPGVGQTCTRNNTWSGLEQMTPRGRAAPAGPAYIRHGWMWHSKWTTQDHHYARCHPQMDLGLRGCYLKLLSLKEVCWNGYEQAEACRSRWMIGNRGPVATCLVFPTCLQSSAKCNTKCYLLSSRVPKLNLTLAVVVHNTKVRGSIPPLHGRLGIQFKHHQHPLYAVAPVGRWERGTSQLVWFK